MIGSWFSGVIVALGHHFYYGSLGGSPTDVYQSILGFDISSQQINAAIGTSFTFIVRALLIFATSIAYIQIFWRAAKHPTKQNTLEDLDTMFSGLSNILAFKKGSVWQKYPLLLLLALISWYPISLLARIPHTYRKVGYFLLHSLYHQAHCPLS